MDYTTLGGSGLEISPVALGCMGVGDPERGAHPWSLAGEQADLLVRTALDLGINFFDTANTYSDGTSEEILGRALRRHARRDEIVIASKVGLPTGTQPNARGLSRKAILTQLDATLRRLDVDYLDLYQLHRWDPHTAPDETLAALEIAVRSGKVLYLGASSMPSWQFMKLILSAQTQGLSFVSMQSHYNLVYREEEREMIPLCMDQSVAVLPWSPLARGVLTTPWGTTNVRTAADSFRAQLYSGIDRPLVDLVEGYARDYGVSMALVAMSWVANRPGVTAPIVGATEPEHLHEAVAALSWTLPHDAAASLDAAYRPHPVAGIEVLSQHEERSMTVTTPLEITG